VSRHGSISEDHVACSLLGNDLSDDNGVSYRDVDGKRVRFTPSFFDTSTQSIRAVESSEMIVFKVDVSSVDHCA
jgi:hypothetical protein